MDLIDGFRVGEFDVEPLSGYIKGPKGVAHLQPKVIDVLLCLARQAGQVVERDAILDAVWGRVASEEVLTRCISQLRGAFGDDRANPVFIQTVPKRGYRFVQAVSASSADAVSIIEKTQSGAMPNERPPSLDSALASVVVMPFENLSRDGGNVADAFAYELQSNLARVDRLRVTSRRSAFALRNSELDACGIGKRLNVDYAISGSLQCDGNRLIVHVELDDSRIGDQVWAKRYDRAIDDLLNVQREIAEAVVTSFTTQKQIRELHWVRQASTESLDAWGLVQKARSLTMDYTAESLSAAIELLQPAIENDPGYAAAHATLASLLVEQLINSISERPADDESAARAAATRALQLAAQDPFILKMVGLAWSYFGDHRKALACLRRAAHYAPFDFGIWGYMGWSLTATGQDADRLELLEILERLIENEPEHPGLSFWLYHQSSAYTCMGRWSEAQSAAESALEHRPGFAIAYVHLANILGQQNRHQAARDALQCALDINPNMTTDHFISLMRKLSSDDRVISARTAGLSKLRDESLQI